MISLSFINDEYENLIASDPFFYLEQEMVTFSNDIDNCLTHNVLI